MDTLDMLLNELETEVHKAKKATFSSDIMMDKNRLLELISRMRNSLPQVINEARGIKENEEKILSDAKGYADGVMADANEKARLAISQTEIIRQATADARAMREEAEENYRRKDYESRALSYQILENAEKVLADSISLINDKKRKLIEE